MVVVASVGRWRAVAVSRSEGSSCCPYVCVPVCLPSCSAPNRGHRTNPARGGSAMVAALWNVVAGSIPGVGGRFVSSTLSEECPTKYGGGGGAHGDSARGTARGSRAGPPHADIPHGAAPLTRHAVGVVVGGVGTCTHPKKNKDPDNKFSEVGKEVEGRRREHCYCRLPARAGPLL